MHPDDVERFWEQADGAGRQAMPFNIDCPYRIRGALRWCRLKSCPRRLSDGLIVRDGAVIDITERKPAGDGAAPTAQHRCAHRTAQSRGTAGSAGGRVLRTVAARIRDNLRSDDLAGRMGDDERLVLLLGIGDAATATAWRGPRTTWTA